MESLRRWWRNLWRRAARPATTGPAGVDRGGGARSGSGAAGIEDADAVRRTPARRHYTAPPADADPRREAQLGAVLEALAGGPLSRAELGPRVGAAEWGPGRLDAVVAHGVATGVLVETSDGGVRTRYAD